MLAILDIQHAGKPGRTDRGASKGGMTEVEITRAYATAAAGYLGEDGIECMILTSGTYDQRHRRAIDLSKLAGGPVAYVACHVNAGGGSYGLVCHDSRSNDGKALARVLGERLAPLAGKVRVEDADPHGAWANAYHTIDGLWYAPAKCVGVCFEPGFIDSDAHAGMWTSEGRDKLGRALANGVRDWLRGAA